jgi:hypothetical protein
METRVPRRPLGGVASRTASSQPILGSGRPINSRTSFLGLLTAFDTG